MAASISADVIRKPVELTCRLDQRGVAARRYLVDDRAGCGLDIGRDLALRREKRVEPPGEIGAAAV
jgi:hypothetical protein